MLMEKKLVLTSLPRSSANGLTKEARRSLFDEAAKADADYENAKKVTESMLAARSAVIEKILLTCGKGPFIVNDERVVIVKRGATYFFRSQNNQAAIEI